MEAWQTCGFSRSTSGLMAQVPIFVRSVSHGHVHSRSPGVEIVCSPFKNIPNSSKFCYIPTLTIRGKYMLVTLQTHTEGGSVGNTLISVSVLGRQSKADVY